MSEKEISELIDLLYPHFLKKLKSENAFKNCIKSTNATVSSLGEAGTSNIEKEVAVKFPYDSAEVFMKNKTGYDVKVDDLVCVHYYIDLKNAYIAYKV